MIDSLFNPKGRLIIEDVHAWMDGGTVTLITKDAENRNYEIDFVQKVSLVKRDNLPCPGSLRLDNKEVEIRSELEATIISFVKNADWGKHVIEKERKILSKIISDCIEFVISDKYLEVAKQVGRIN